MTKKINIIGAGISGLTAGCYLQMNGYETQIFEMHNIPGGLCTSWERKGYTVNGCIHWLMGATPDDQFHALWKELIDIDKIDFVFHDEFFRVEDGKGGVLRVYTNLERLEQEMLGKAPEDEKIIREILKTARRFAKVDYNLGKAPELYNLMDYLNAVKIYLPHIRLLMKWSKKSGQDIADGCKNPLLKKVFEFIFVPEMTALFIMMTLSSMNKRSAGYPIGGSLKFAELLEERYLSLGGKIHYQSPVAEILVREHTAMGILLQNGTIHDSDMVISAADGHHTIYELLHGKYINGEVRKIYGHFLPFSSYIMVSLGVNRTFDKDFHSVAFPAQQTIFLDDKTQTNDISVHLYNYDKTLAPEGRTLVTVGFETRNDQYWTSLRRTDPAKYKAEKERIAAVVIDELETRFGQIKDHIEMIDVMTPATVIRYTNNWKGSFEGWILTPKVGLKRLKKTLPGLKGFYMIGHWVEPGGGLPACLLSGRNVSEIITHKDRKKFISKK
ncbi:MAG: NAD(P)/FAD-dependent oxidoreductase [Bacteroidetes bacterium]|nr:NAD(P)/FAD-dependent oxidoreductase [Bacteroidota bacterium]